MCDPNLPVTGATVRMGAFIKYLARCYDIDLVNMMGSGHRVAPDIEQRYHSSQPALPVSRRVKVDFSQSGYFLYSHTLYRHAERLLQSGAYNYLLVDYGLAAIYGKLLANRYGLPLIYSSHNVEYRWYLEQARNDFRRLLLAPYVYWAERAACHAARLVVTASKIDRHIYTRWIPDDRIEVIPQGFDPDVSHPFYAPPAGSPAVALMLGNFRDKNNRQAARQIVHDVLPQVVKSRPDTRFQFIGAEPPDDLSGPHIECLGFVDDLKPYLHRANLLLAPMQFAYGMSTKVVLGLAYGKTVLTTPRSLRCCRVHTGSSLYKTKLRTLDIVE